MYEEESKVLLGINAMGLRIRHRSADRAIREKWKFSRVIEAFNAFYFDPEFFKSPLSELIKKYQSEFPEDPLRPMDSKEIKQLIFNTES